jgi:hypothetical protein
MTYPKLWTAFHVIHVMPFQIAITNRSDTAQKAIKPTQ